MLIEITSLSRPCQRGSRRLSLPMGSRPLKPHVWKYGNKPQCVNCSMYVNIHAFRTQTCWTHSHVLRQYNSQLLNPRLNSCSSVWPATSFNSGCSYRREPPGGSDPQWLLTLYRSLLVDWLKGHFYIFSKRDAVNKECKLFHVLIFWNLFKKHRATITFWFDLSRLCWGLGVSLQTCVVQRGAMLLQASSSPVVAQLFNLWNPVDSLARENPCCNLTHMTLNTPRHTAFVWSYRLEEMNAAVTQHERLRLTYVILRLTVGRSDWKDGCLTGTDVS